MVDAPPVESRANTGPNPSEGTHLPPIPSKTAAPRKMSESQAREIAEGLFRKQNVNIVSGKEKIEHTNKKGHSTDSVEIVEEARREVARSRMTEEESEWKDKKGGPAVARWAKRWYFYGVNNLAHYRHQKEQAYVELAEAGLQMGAFHVDFQRDLNEAALKIVQSERSNKALVKRIGNNKTLDFINAATFTQNRLEKQRVKILQDLRVAALSSQADYDRITTNPANPDEVRVAKLLIENPELLDSFKQELTGDFEAAEGLAQLLSEDCGKDAIRTVIGEKRSNNELILKKDTSVNEPVAQKEFRIFLQNEIILPLLNQGLTKGSLSNEMLLEARTRMQESFFTKRFAVWRDSLDPTMREHFDVSLSYGSDVIPMVQNMLPEALNVKEYLMAQNRLEDYVENMVLTVRVGTLKAGEQGTVQEGVLEKMTARSLSNRNVLAKHNALLKSREPSPVIPNAYYDSSASRANFLIKGYSGGKRGLKGTSARALNHFWGAAAVGVGVGVYMSKSALRAKASLVAPFIGGAAVGSAIRAVEESARFKRKAEYHRRQTNQGYEYSADAPERKIFTAGDLPTIGIEDQISRMRSLSASLRIADEVSNVLPNALGILADVEARRILMDSNEDIEMYGKALHENMNTKRKELTMAKAEAIVALKAHYATRHADLIALASRFNISIPPVSTGRKAEDVIIDHLIQTLGQSRAANLEQGTSLDGNFVAALQEHGLASAGVAETIFARNKVLDKARHKVMFRTAGIGFLVGVGIPALEHFGVTPILSALDNTAPGNALIGGIGRVEGAIENFGPIRTIGNLVGEVHDTVGHSIATGKVETAHLSPNSIGKHLNIDLPKGYSATLIGNNEVQFTGIGPDGHTVTHQLGYVDDPLKGGHFTDSPAKVAAEMHSWFPQLKIEPQILHNALNSHDLNPNTFNPTTDALHGTNTTVDIGGQSVVINLPNGFHYVGFNPASSDLEFRMDGDPSGYIHHFTLTPDAHGFINAQGTGSDANENFLIYVQRPGTMLNWENFKADVNLEQQGVFEQNNLNISEHSNFSEWHALTGKWRGYEAAGHIDDGATYPGGNGSKDPSWFNQYNTTNFGARLSDHDVPPNPFGFEKPEVTMMQTRPDLFPTFASAHDYILKHPDLLGSHQDQLLNQIIHNNMNVVDTLQNGSHAIKVEDVCAQITVQEPDGVHNYLLVDNPPGSGKIAFPKNLPRSAIKMIRWGVLTEKTSGNPLLLIDPHSSLHANMGKDVTFQEFASKPVNLTDSTSVVIVPDQINTVKFDLIQTPTAAFTPMDIPITPLPWIASHRPLEAPLRGKRPVIVDGNDLPPNKGLDTDNPLLPPIPKGPDVSGFTYYGSTGENKTLELAIADWLRVHKSPTLDKDPGAKLDPYKEISGYLERQDPEYLAEIKLLANEITTPASPNLKAIVCIPVAGHQEGKQIYTTLQNFTTQTIPSDQFEILLFVNRPATNKDGSPTSSQETLDSIAQFQRDYPGFPVRVVEKVLPPDQAKIGRIRKYGSDIALYRQQQRGPGGGDVVLISNDADQKGISPKYLESFIAGFEKDSNVEVMLGQLDWDPEAYAEYPLVHIGTRLFQSLNAIGRKNTGRMVSSGANSAFRASSYAVIGGYIINLQGGEDIAMGKAVIEARGDDHTKLAYAGARNSRLYTSARRAIDALNSGLAPVDQWRKGFSAFDDEVRLLELGSTKGIDYSDPAQVVKLKAGLEWVINATLEEYEAGEVLGKGSNYYRRALRYLGFTYKVENNKIVITNMDAVARRLENYEKIAVIQRDMKAGKATPESRAQLSRLLEDFRAETFPTPTNLFAQDKLSETTDVSPALIANQNLVLDPVTERKRYIDGYDKNYKDQLTGLNTEIGEPMKASTEIVVCIPVSGIQESQHIYDCLAEYSAQTMDANKFEVLLVVNTPDKVSPRWRNEVDETIAAVEKAQRDFPNVAIRMVNVSIPSNQLRMGNLRKITADLALQRAEEAGITRDIILISNDANNEGMTQNYLEQYANYFATHPEKEVAAGNVQFDPKSFIRFPEYAAYVEFITLLDQQGLQNGNITLYGSNAAIKSSIYSAVGGYPSKLVRGEQDALLDTIEGVRKSSTTFGYAEGALVTKDNTKGLLNYIDENKLKINSPDADNSVQLPNLNLDEFPIFNWDDSNAVDAMRLNIESTLNQLINAYDQGEHLGKNSWYYIHNLEKLGLMVRVDGDPKDPNSIIVITDMTKFINRQRNIRDAIASGAKNMANLLISL